MNGLEWLQRWFASECDGDWEHNQVVRLTATTLDNPGWAIDIELTDTPLEQAPFAPVEADRTENDWVRCKVEGGKFLGRGGPLNLTEIVEVFASWARAYSGVR